MHKSFIPAALTPLRAVSYVRVSTTRQAVGGADHEGFSIPAQREANRRRAYELGALVVAEFIDRGRSGRSTDRPELRRMLDYVTATPVDYVIVHKIDRLARNRGDDAALTDAILATGARLISSTEAIGSSPSGRLLHGIMASIAEFYSQNLATEVMKGMRQKAAQGGTPGRAPLGYLNQRRVEDGREVRYVIVDPERGPHIAWAFQEYATGTWSITRLAEALNARGVTTKPGPNTPTRPLTRRSVHHVLRNPYFKGIVVLNGAEHKGTHEPLVDSDTWAAAQDVLDAHRNGERSSMHDHYLKSTVFCIACSRRLILQNARSRNGRIYCYYVCIKRTGSECRQRRALPVRSVEERVAIAHRSIALSREQRTRIERTVLERIGRDDTTRQLRAGELVAEAAKLAERQEKLLEVYYSDAIPREMFTKSQKKLSVELSQVHRELDLLRSSEGERIIEIQRALDLLQDPYGTYLAATEPVRKQLNRKIFTRILLGAESHQIATEFNDPFREIIAARAPLP